MSGSKFIKQFWKDKKMIGSIVPSSKFLAEKMLENINFNKTNIIIEIGPGNGVFTKKILEKMSPDSLLLVFELNDHFIQVLKKTILDKRVVFIHDSAEKIQEHLSQRNIHGAEVIISSLPFSNFPIDLRNTIVQSIYNAILSGGLFVQFQYSTQCKDLFKSLFKNVNISFTAFNFPPAFVYTCTK